MAWADYKICDCCGGRKVFYDADIQDERYRATFGEKSDYDPIGLKAICGDCNKTHEVVIVSRGAADRIEAMAAQIELWRTSRRETFDAMCAMRDSINEHIPMPSLESDLLQGPEDSVFCATVAEAVINHVGAHAALIAERDAARDAALEEAAAECDRLRASYARSTSTYADDDPEKRKIRWSGAVAAVAAENIRALKGKSHE